MTAEAASLFDRPAQPVFGLTSAWSEGVLGGSLATSLCVIAVVFFGLLLLTGRLHVRRSVEVVLGCFLLLGAGALAAQLQHLGQKVASAQALAGEQIIVPETARTQAPSPARYDPYAGASLNQD